MKFFIIFAIFTASQAKIPAKSCKSLESDFTIDGKNYYFSGFHDAIKTSVGWLDARKACRKYCMDTISVNTQKEFDVVRKLMEDHKIQYLWTSGYVCDYVRCPKDSLPQNINGWSWLDKKTKIPPTDVIAPGWKENPWSTTGYFKRQQPDNAEFEVNRVNESCLAILHNVYDDGIKFHDVACYHKKEFICEEQ